MVEATHSAPAAPSQALTQRASGARWEVLLAILIALIFFDWAAFAGTPPPHLISWLIFIPLIGAIAILFMPRQAPVLIRRFSMGAAIVEMWVSAWLLQGDYSTPDFQFTESLDWIPSFGIRYEVGVDGISLWLILLTTVLTPIALYVSYNSISTKIKEFAFSFLLLEVGMVGAFVALDLFLFYVFWEVMLVPMFLIIGVWGGKDRIYAALKFFIYTMVGSLLMLIAILYLVGRYHELSGSFSFSLSDLLRLQLSHSEQIALFLAFALAFAIKVPLFPFHTWLPDAHVQAPTGGSVILAAVLLKLGGYGFLRFAMPLFPYASHLLGPSIAVLAVVGILYGAACAWVQRDVKKLVAYSSVSHLGFVMLGIFSVARAGVEGAILQMIAHGVSTGALFILVGVIYDRRHTRDLADFGGLAKIMPNYSIIFVIVAMSSIGLPGTNGFVGEFMILNGAFHSMELSLWERVFALFAGIGVIFAAIYMLHAVLRLFWGPLSNPENQALPDLNHREKIALIPLVIAIFWMGLAPNTLLERMRPSVSHWTDTYVSAWRDSHANNKTQLRPKGEAPNETQSSIILNSRGGVG
ncbi:MAG: NADH-quinone oxidoreductase subunit M [Sandaracinaceae bacterium]|nr:NADH-quinone oxidoreductase subunit M [Sandaracinaceae bacterium]